MSTLSSGQAGVDFYASSNKIIMSSCSLLAQVRSLNQEIRQENDKMYGLLRTLLHTRSATPKTSVGLLDEVGKHREEVKRRTHLSDNLGLKKTKSTSMWPKVELRTMHSKSTKRC